MILVKSSEEARRGRIQNRVTETSSYVTSYFGANMITLTSSGAAKPAMGVLFPVAHLVEQLPGSVSRAHFHQVDQYQIFVAGSGEFSGKPVRGITVHYANAYTPYGPICAGEEGISFFTLRSEFDPGPRHMPDSREELKRATRQPREAVVELIEPRAAARSVQGSIRAVLAPEADGVGAWRYDLAPGEAGTGPDPRSGGGQYWLVLSGALEHGGALLSPLSCLFVSAEEEPLTATAGADGLDLLVLQFRQRSLRAAA